MAKAQNSPRTELCTFDEFRVDSKYSKAKTNPEASKKKWCVPKTCVHCTHRTQPNFAMIFGALEHGCKYNVCCQYASTCTNLQQPCPEYDCIWNNNISRPPLKRRYVRTHYYFYFIFRCVWIYSAKAYAQGISMTSTRYPHNARIYNIYTLSFRGEKATRCIFNTSTDTRRRRHSSEDCTYFVCVFTVCRHPQYTP